MKKIRTGHIVAGLVGAGVSAVLTSRPTAARISDSENQVKQIEARYDLKKAQLQTAIATTNDRNEEIRHLNELIATYESQVNELTSALEITEDAMLRMFDDFKNKTQELEERSSKLESANAQAQKNAEHATKLVAQYQQELSAARDKITLLESKQDFQGAIGLHYTNKFVDDNSQLSTGSVTSPEAEFKSGEAQRRRTVLILRGKAKGQYWKEIDNYAKLSDVPNTFEVTAIRTSDNKSFKFLATPGQEAGKPTWSNSQYPLSLFDHPNIQQYTKIFTDHEDILRAFIGTIQ